MGDDLRVLFNVYFRRGYERLKPEQAEAIACRGKDCIHFDPPLSVPSNGNTPKASRMYFLGRFHVATVYGNRVVVEGQSDKNIEVRRAIEAVNRCLSEYA